MNAIYRFPTLCLAGLLLAAPSAPAQDWVFPELSWKEPDFRDRFMGRYGVNAYTEPQMDVENFNIYQGVLTQIDDKEAAIAYLENGIRVLTGARVEVSGALHFLLASLNYERGRKAVAVERYIDAIRAHPAFLRAYANLGYVLMELGEEEKALPVLLKAVELGANEAQVHGLIGHIYARKGLYASGLTSFQWALVFSPQNNAWRQGMLRCLIGLERHAEAVGVAREVLAFDRRSAGAWMNAARLHAHLRQPDEAIVHLQAAHALGGGSHESHSLLGTLYYNKEMYEPACDALVVGAATAATAEDLKALLDPCLGFSRLEHTALADRLLAALEARAGELAIRIDPATAGIVRAASLSARGDAAAAERILEPLAREVPESGDVQLALARLHLQTGRLAEAEARFEIARTFPDLAHVALYEHARIALARGDVTRALALLHEAHTLKPDPALAEHIRTLEDFRR